MKYAVLIVLAAAFVVLVYGDVIPTNWRASGPGTGGIPLVTGVKNFGSAVGTGFERAADQF